MKDSDTKTYLISDNTGSGVTSGGSDKLVQYMEDEYYDAALNTKNGIVEIPKNGFISATNSKMQEKGVRLG